jgi:hypothetical protein
LILFDAHHRIVAGGSEDRALNNKSQLHATMKTHRPLDNGFNELPWQKGFAGRKQQALAADVQALADTNFVQNEPKSGAPAFDCQPQRETQAIPAIGEIPLPVVLVLFRCPSQFCCGRRHLSLTWHTSRPAIIIESSIVLTPLQHAEP